ncbi:flagellin [Magnetospirillum sulfuroxidans]|uniref:Flagellin n=1 Tax=Magnetospirillum sulfuroxidans TaxID=611300 RepID=A0ABS5I9C0_9PROT|nr:flagellin [Magnetospirillum sulfuroxidans]MBR9971035.1 flagellin [Magnetospirillum sulfuroxidans]
MAIEVTLTAGARQNLTSIQATEKLVGRTQGRLSTGLKVSSVVDDAVAFFQGRALGDRAKGFMQTKDGIANGIGSIKAAMDGLSSVEDVIIQMKGLALAAKTESRQDIRHQMYQQYTELRKQLDAIANDCHFNGMNLIGNPASDVSVQLSPAGAEPMATLDIRGISITADTLGLEPATVDVSTANYASDAAVRAKFDNWAAGMIAMTNSGAGPAVATETILSGIGANKALSSGGSWVLLSDADGMMSLDAEDPLNSLTADEQYRAVVALQGYMSSGGNPGDEVYDIGSGLVDGAFTSANYPALTVSMHDYPWESQSHYIGNIDHHIATLDSALRSVRATMAEMGNNIALLQVRDGFAGNAALIATEGAGKMINADLDEEGANMVALQTRAQLGLQALSLAGQADQAVLNLF